MKKKAGGENICYEPIQKNQVLEIPQIWPRGWEAAEPRKQTKGRDKKRTKKHRGGTRVKYSKNVKKY